MHNFILLHAYLWNGENKDDNNNNNIHCMNDSLFTDDSQLIRYMDDSDWECIQVNYLKLTVAITVDYLFGETARANQIT